MSEGLQEAVESYLAKSGRRAQLADHLRERLEDTGWYDRIQALARRELAVSPDCSVRDTTERLQASALSLVPEDVKTEMLDMIRSVVDQMVEKPK